MHELNYFHQKHITHLFHSVQEFEKGTGTLALVKKNIFLTSQPPSDCLRLIGPFESFIMGTIKTDGLIQLCANDVQGAKDVIQKIEDFKMGNLDKPSLLILLYQAVDEFEKTGVEFDPLVEKTVEIIFAFVITIIIGKAFIVPIFGFFLSRSVAKDYQALSNTKINLEKEKKHSALIQSERMTSLNTLVAGIAHEVNTPVGVSITANSHVQEMLNQIKQAYESEELTENDFCQFFIEIEEVNNIIHDNLIRTSTLIKSFKQVSGDQATGELELIKFKSYIEHVLVSLSPLTKKSNMLIKLACNKELQGHIYGGALTEVITNIVTNAINHAFKDNKKGTLLISVIQTTENEIILSFEDDGCGISEIDLVHIFDPFFTTSRGSGGTGLGLHILHNLVVDKLKGRVSCSSKIGQGTRIEIYLPIDFHI